MILKKIKNNIIEMQVTEEEFEMLKEGLLNTDYLGSGPGYCDATYDTTKEYDLYEFMEDFEKEFFKQFEEINEGE